MENQPLHSLLPCGRRVGIRVEGLVDDGWLFGVPGLHSRRAPGTTCLSALRAGGRGRTPHAVELSDRHPGVEGGVWYGVSGPAGMPKPVVDRLNAEIRKIVATPEIRDALAGVKCRCGTHTAILRAVKRAAKAMA